MRLIILTLLMLAQPFSGACQNNWTLSLSGYDQTYSPADFATATNGDVYVNGVKAGTNGFINKLFRSTDQGTSWTEITTMGLGNLGNVHSLTISGNTMIVGGMDVVATNGAKIFTSSDNGVTWTLSMNGYDPSYSPADFAITGNGDIYVNGVKYDSGIGGFVNKLFKSIDKGKSWAEVSTTGLTNLGNIHSLTISGSNMLLAGMDIVSNNGAKIFISSDNGASWTLSMAGFDQTYSPADFVTANNGDVYINGVKYNSGIGGFASKLYKSIDQGRSWTEVSTTGLTDLGNVHSITISGSKMMIAGMDVVSSKGAKIFVSNFLSTNVHMYHSEHSKAINIYPNPFVDGITIDFEENDIRQKHIKISCMDGKIIKCLSTSSSKLFVDLGDLPSGSYIVNVKYSSGRQTFKAFRK